MTKPLISVLVLSALAAAGCGSGAQNAGPPPTTTSSSGSTTRTTQSTDSTQATTTTTSGGMASLPLCSDRSVGIAIAGQQGAAGTISTTWRLTNNGTGKCRSFGYPGMDFHTSSGWLNVQVHRGGLAEINAAPGHVVVDPGRSLYFVSFWGDADTSSGPCKRFDRVKITLPDNFVSAQVPASGCVDPELVDVGPVSSTHP